MPKPLFVVGKHRSGTTWLGNLLLEHPQIAGVQHEDHRGIHESAFFSHVSGRYGDLNKFANFVEFAAAVSRSDYFRLLGVSFEDLMELYPASYADVFRTVMGRFAVGEDAVYWIEKSPMHTHRICQIGRTYSDARFVGMWRDPVDMAFSWLRLHDLESGLQRLMGLARVTIDKYVADAHMLRMREEWSDRVCVARYSDLVEEKNRVLGRICSFLGIPYVEMQSQYVSNTSYQGDRQREMPPAYEKKFVRWLYSYGLRVLPPEGLRVLKIALRRRKREPLPDWFFQFLR